MDRVMELLNVQRNGLQRVKGVKSALFLRRSSSVEIVDLRELPSQFVETRIEYVPRKTQIKDALKGGQAVPGEGQNWTPMVGHFSMLFDRQTCRLQGKRTFPILVDAVKNFFYGQSPELSRIQKAN